jgi:hypothetical protein
MTADFTHLQQAAPIATDERRRHPRRAVRLRTEARRLDDTELAKRHPRVGLTLQNLSEGGLAAITRSAVAVGERLAVQFNHARVVGRVIRCASDAMGYRLAIRFE